MLALGCSPGAPTEDELSMILAASSLLADSAARFEPERLVVFNSVLYPDRDSVRVPERVMEWARDVAGLPILTSAQVEAEDPSIVILTLYPTLRSEGGQVPQTVDYFYFEREGGAFSNDWTFVIGCDEGQPDARRCEVVERIGPGVSDYGPG